MIPLTLKLSNFTSYGAEVPELDFSKIHLAAISGQNGAGKSSLLDSLTWCLWGTSRLGDSSDQLVRLGQPQMWVEFSFKLDEHIFTVKRSRVLKGGGSTTLELLSNSHNLTEGTIKSTQQKIIDALRLSYETFVNSAFIRQGHADEFTTKGATERKRILADILGLSHYDVFEERAKEKAKEAAGKLSNIGGSLIEIEAELSQKEARERTLSQVETEIEKADKELASIESEIKTTQLEREVVATKLKSLEEAQARLSAIEKELADLKIQISLKEKAQAEYQLVLDQGKEIEENYQKLQEYKNKRQALESKRTELIEVKDELNALQKKINERETNRQKAIADVEIKKQACQTKKQQLEEQNQKLSEQKSTCPTCGQIIGKDKTTEIIQKNKDEISQIDQEISQYAATIKKYQEVIFPEITQAGEKEDSVKKLEEETKDYRDIFETTSNLSKYEDLHTKLAQAETAVKTHQEAVADLNQIYQSKQKQIEIESKNLSDLTTYQKELEEIKGKLETQEAVKLELAQKTRELHSQQGAAKELVSRIAQFEKLLAEKQVEKAQLQKDKEAFEELALAFGKKGIQAMIIETAIPELEEETNSLLDKLTEGRMKVHLETQRETKTKVAGGEKGIVETLDIIISDEMGERPYEAYSGGEQFRVNFAIRLALSRLLTHRAGAKLQFLVIDEGFGTQDAQGRSRIVEALEAIKDDFEKIIVITHLEELKEEFPVRIEVQKGSSGSTFEVVGV